MELFRFYGEVAQNIGTGSRFDTALRRADKLVRKGLKGLGKFRDCLRISDDFNLKIVFFCRSNRLVFLRFATSAAIWWILQYETEPSMQLPLLLFFQL